MRTTVRVIFMGLLIGLLVAPSAMADDAIRMAVSYFDNTSKAPELEPLKKGLAEMLITDLSVSKEIRLVERSRLNDVMKELDLQKSAYVDPKSAAKLGKGLGAAYIVVGSYLVQGDAIRIDARLIDVESSDVALGVKQEGKTNDFFGLQRGLAEQLLKGVGATLNLLQKKKLGKGSTRNYAAFSQYAAGLDHLDRGDETAAKTALEAAVKADPDFKAARALKKQVDEMAKAIDLTLQAEAIEATARWRVSDGCECSFGPAPADDQGMPQEIFKEHRRIVPSQGYPSLRGNLIQFAMRQALMLANLGLDSEASEQARRLTHPDYLRWIYGLSIKSRAQTLSKACSKKATLRAELKTQFEACESYFKRHAATEKPLVAGGAALTYTNFSQPLASALLFEDPVLTERALNLANSKPLLAKLDERTRQLVTKAVADARKTLQERRDAIAAKQEFEAKYGKEGPLEAGLEVSDYHRSLETLSKALTEAGAWSAHRSLRRAQLVRDIAWGRGFKALPQAALQRAAAIKDPSQLPELVELVEAHLSAAGYCAGAENCEAALEETLQKAQAAKKSCRPSMPRRPRRLYYRAEYQSLHKLKRTDPDGASKRLEALEATVKAEFAKWREERKVWDERCGDKTAADVKAAKQQKRDYERHRATVERVTKDVRARALSLNASLKKAKTPRPKPKVAQGVGIATAVSTSEWRVDLPPALKPRSELMRSNMGCFHYQVASYLEYRQLRFDRAMSFQQKAVSVPEYPYKEICLSGSQLVVVGVKLQKPLKEMIQEAIENPRVFKRLKAKKAARDKLAEAAEPKIRARQKTLTCADVCPWAR